MAYRILGSVLGPQLIFGALAILGGVLVGGGLLLVRSSGADVRRGRRLGGAKAYALADLQRRASEDDLPDGPIRVSGRVRCRDPLLDGEGDRLVAFHRDVEAQLPDGSWQPIERVRETRALQLWERAAAVSLDLAAASEPLITLPQVWEGDTTALDTSYLPATTRLQGAGARPGRARSTTRRLTLVDQLTVLTEVARGPDGELLLRPPAGGFLVTNLDIDVAMRILGGKRPSLLRWGILLAGLGVPVSAAAVAYAAARLLD